MSALTGADIHNKGNHRGLPLQPVTYAVQEGDPPPGPRYIRGAGNACRPGGRLPLYCVPATLLPLPLFPSPPRKRGSRTAVEQPSTLFPLTTQLWTPAFAGATGRGAGAAIYHPGGKQWLLWVASPTARHDRKPHGKMSEALYTFTCYPRPLRSALILKGVDGDPGTLAGGIALQLPHCPT